MVLLTGPAGSGKTFRILEELRQALRRRDPGVRLLTPTATMAQHLQNQLAREGYVFRPGLIQTLSRFIDPFAADLPLVSEPLLYLIVEEAAAQVDRPEFARVVRLHGFCAALARTIEEFSSAGCDAESLAARMPGLAAPPPLGDAFVAVYREVQRKLARRGLATRSQRLAHAAAQIAEAGLPGIHTIWLDGFYALPDPELAVIRAICRHAQVTLTLPSTAITEPTRAHLLAIGFVAEPCAFSPRRRASSFAPLPPSSARPTKSPAASWNRPPPAAPSAKWASSCAPRMSMSRSCAPRSTASASPLASISMPTSPVMPSCAI